MSNHKILIVEDEPQIRKLLKLVLEAQDYKIIVAENGKEGIQLAYNFNPDLIILDLGLPDINGQEVLLKIREFYAKPLIILTVNANEEEVVRALDNGATDYMVKPFRNGELLARLRSCLRRYGNDHEINEVAVFDDLSIDYSARTLKKNEEILKLTITEFQLLELFTRNEGRVLTHHYLLKEIWGVGHQTDTQYLRVFIGNLRKKIEDNPQHPKHIITENGIGYRFC